MRVAIQLSVYSTVQFRPTISVAMKILVYASSHSLLLKPGCYARYLLYRREALYNKKLRQNYIVVGLFVTSMSRSLFTVFRVRVKCSRLSLLCSLYYLKSRLVHSNPSYAMQCLYLDVHVAVAVN